MLLFGPTRMNLSARNLCFLLLPSFLLPQLTTLAHPSNLPRIIEVCGIQPEQASLFQGQVQVPSNSKSQSQLYTHSLFFNTNIFPALLVVPLSGMPSAPTAAVSSTSHSAQPASQRFASDVSSPGGDASMRLKSPSSDGHHS